MKKTYILLLALLMGVSVFAQRKSVEMLKNSVSRDISEIAPDFTLTDLDGNSHTLYDYLAAGKTVVIDFSATWCAPCWSYQQSHVLADVYNTYGPAGTDEMMVFMIEVDGSTTLDDLNGTGSNTQGDWVTGTPYPIIESSATGSDYAVAYVPYIVMICPTHDYWEAGQLQSAAEFYTMAQTCPSLTDPPTADFLNPGSAMMGVAANFEDASLGLPTSWEWTFQGGTPASSTDQNPSCTWSAAGTYDVTLVASNANGSSAPVTKQINIIDPASTNNLMVTFEECVNSWGNDFSPYLWTAFDGDEGSCWADYGDAGITGEQSFNVYDHADGVSLGLTTLEPHGGNKAGMCMNVVTADAPNDDWFISPQVQLGGASTISLWAASLSTQWGPEEFYIAVSTTGNDPADFTDVSPKYQPGDAYEEFTFDLSAYNGQMIYVAIHCVSNDHWVLMIDDINVSTDLGVEEVYNNIHIYPNPSTGIVNVENVAGSTILVYNVLGEVVSSIANADQFNAIDLSSFDNGTYIIKILSNNDVYTKKLVLNR